MPMEPVPSPEGEGCRLSGRESRGLERLANALEDSRGAVEDLAVLEPQDRDPETGEPPVAHVITQRHRVVTGTIGFDDETRLLAEEVDDEGANGMLPPKLRALELAPS